MWKIALLSLSLLVSGCMSMKAYNGLRMGMSVKNMTQVEARYAVEALYEGASMLRSCDALIQQYPKNHERLFRYIVGREATVTVRKATWNEVEAVEVQVGVSITAYVYPGRMEIFLDPAHLHCQKCDLSRTMAHELLHLAGLPGHTKPLDKKVDPVYLLLPQCGFRGY